ncbi:MAG TPA: hypothetical protein PK280_19970 [Planctomycetota bacterium]|nr:hypothetical protein [Planctomycetota bacterium]
MTSVRLLASAIIGVLALGLVGGCAKETPSGNGPTPGKVPGAAQTPAGPVAPKPPTAGPTVIEPAKPDPAKTEPAKTEPAKTEPPKAELPKAEPPKTEPAPAASKDVVWIEDDLPADANAQMDGEDAWTWVTENPAPKSGKKCHQSNTAEGEHQHFFTGATATMEVKAGDRLFVWVWLDAGATPGEVMLQWHENDSWEHRAYWGANSIEWGEDGTVSRQNMGALPEKGKWVRLEVPAEKVGLEGKTVDGMAFTLFGGKATWDAAGRVPAK